MDKRLKKAYKKNAAALALLFTYSSNIQIASDFEDYQDALENVIKEVNDAHYFEILREVLEGKEHLGLACVYIWFTPACEYIGKCLVNRCLYSIKSMA